MQLALSHKRTVGFFKLLSVIGAIVIICTFYIWFRSKETTADGVEHFGEIKNKKSDSSNKQISNYEINIQNLLFEGFNKDHEPYKIIADKALKLPGDLYNLETIDGEYKTNRYNLQLHARKGKIDNNVKLIKLKDNVQVFVEDVIFNGEEIEIDLLNKEIISNISIQMLYKNSTVKADSFSSMDNNNIVNFKGHVKTKINISDF